jgi:hypothetical protein
MQEKLRPQSYHRRRFEQTIICIRKSCASTVDMTLLQDLTKEHIVDAIGALTESREMISRLLRKLILIGGTVTER